jgi:radical SAM superfamily enzyme YgiQ (UPF0313 family)
MLISLPGYQKNDNYGGVLYPLGIGYLAGVLKQSYEVYTYHYVNMDITEIIKNITSINPDLIGFTCTTFNRGNVKKTIQTIINKQFKCKIVVGGVHATFMPEQMLSNGADIVIIGEGEKTFEELCRLPYNRVKGIVYKSNDKIIYNEPREPIQNLDDIPFPDYSYASEYIKKSGMACMITSRGCPVRCTFCSTSSFWGQRVRMYSPKRVVDEIEHLISQFGVHKIYFNDDSFNLSIKRVTDICDEIINRGIHIEWSCPCRVKPVSEEMIAIMVKAGCRHISWGIESGSEEMLKKLNKNISLDDIKNAFDISSKYPISTSAYLMVGNVGESEKTITETIELLKTIPLTDISRPSILYVLPGTLLYEDLKNKNLIKDADWNKHSTVPSYTIEQSYLTMLRWADKIEFNQKTIKLLNPEKHFLNDVLINPKKQSIIERIIENPIEYYKKLLPKGKIWM